MSDFIQIKILEKESNRLGDLFGRLMADLFVALGYEQPRLNIHKSGREVDLDANHRLESRRAIGECKAHEEPIGGNDLNKFVGVLDAEFDKKKPLTGYFISLSGFKETAIEQEKQRTRTKIIALTGSQVVEELIKGRILIPKEKATELAGRCCADKTDLTLDPEVELLAHQRGWIWAIYYTKGKERTHYALIHSDGTPLAHALVNEVVISDRNCQGTIENLTCINPKPIASVDTDPRISQALSAYANYLENECGFIQLDGLPADSDIGSRRLRLENLFVPLNLDVTIKEGKEFRKLERQPVGAILSLYPRLGLLAAPGSGKSTLLKRLAVAYVDSNRRQQIDDNLPPRDWLPLFFRCRELRGLARGSFAELLEAVAKREPVRQYATVFHAFVDRALLEGRVLLLVDGLDEISDPGDRAAFVCTVRAALQAYPRVAAVVTSREAGFRHVAAHLASICTHAVLSPFNTDDICRLSVAWHSEVIGKTEKVRLDAEKLANTITKNDRIKRLAINPLLLTTLLLVKRWVGSLPTRRAVLYGKAVEVLLMTWNTEGHEPIPDEEALPQLCYVASAMMFSKVERISRPKLSALLKEARFSLPSELGYVKGTVDEFINRVEDRSSLLMMTGNDIEDGQLVEFFEFRHLTFQEFLTARALVEGWHPERKTDDTLLRVLESHLEDEKWQEVIPLAAVLAGKESEALIIRLTNEVKVLKKSQSFGFNEQQKEIRKREPHPFIQALGNCLADEAPARPETIQAAVYELVLKGEAFAEAKYIPALVLGRYGIEMRDITRKMLTQINTNFEETGQILKKYIWWRTIESEDNINYLQAAESFVEMLNCSEQIVRCEGALGLMRLCFMTRKYKYTNDEYNESIIKSIPILITMIFSEDIKSQFCACWAFVWISTCRIWAPTDQPDIIGRFYNLWKYSKVEKIKIFAGWALGSLPLSQRDSGHFGTSISKKDYEIIARNRYNIHNNLGATDEAANLIIAWYLRIIPDHEIIIRIDNILKEKHLFNDRPPSQTMKDLLIRLGKST